jgi:diguanylate cyclase (GGDEF)-like protein
LYRALEAAIGAARLDREPLSVLAFHVAGMRVLNQNYGYDTGDRILGQVAGCLQDAIGGSHSLSRLTGNEFVCVMPGCSRDEAVRLGELLTAGLNTSTFNTAKGQTTRVEVRVGVSDYSASRSTVDQLLNAAATAARSEGVAVKYFHLVDPDRRLEFRQSSTMFDEEAEDLALKA